MLNSSWSDEAREHLEQLARVHEAEIKGLRELLSVVSAERDYWHALATTPEAQAVEASREALRVLQAAAERHLVTFGQCSIDEAHQDSVTREACYDAVPPLPDDYDPA